MKDRVNLYKSSKRVLATLGTSLIVTVTQAALTDAPISPAQVVWLLQEGV